MDERLVKVYKDSLKPRVFPGQIELFLMVANFDAFAPAEHFDLLVEMLAVQTHKISRLVLL